MNTLLRCLAILAITPGWILSAPGADAAQGSEAITIVTGKIESVQMSICMDGAEGQIRPVAAESSKAGKEAAPVRVIGLSPKVQRFLKSAADTKMLVTVQGYLRRGAECSHLAVQRAVKAQ